MWSSANMARFGGLVGMLDGVLWIALGLLWFLLQPHPWAASSVYDYLAIALFSCALLALVGGLVGLHVRQTERSRKRKGLEKISFSLAVIGATVAAVGNLAEDWLRIALMGWVYLLGIFTLIAGLLFFAIAILQTKVLPRWYGWTLLVGLLGLLASMFGGSILFGLIWLVLGYALWKNQTRGPVPLERVNQETLLHMGEGRR